MSKKTTGKWIQGKIRKRIPALVLMTVSHVGTSLLGVAFALLCKNMIDYAVARDQHNFLLSCFIQSLVIAGIILSGVLYRHLHGVLTADLDRDLKKDIFSHLLRGEYAQVSDYHTGDLLNRLNLDVRTLHEGLLGALPNVAAMVAKLVGAVAVLVVLDPLFTAILLVIGVVVLAVSSLLRNPMKNIHSKVNEEEGKVSGFLQETLEKLLMVQALDVASVIEQRADLLMGERYEAQMKKKNLSLVTNTALTLLLHISGFVALIWCAFGLFAGTITVGVLTAITQLVNQIQRPLVGMSGILPQYTAMLASAERLMALEQIEQEASVGELAVDYTALTSLGAESLSFTYDRDTVFDQADFVLPKGAFSIITGASGLGKSTLLKLLLGILRPDSGRLFMEVDGKRITVDRQTRKWFAYVPQGNLLLSGTLLDNVTLVNPTATKEQIEQALYVSAMDEYVSTLPQGLQTVVGENGAGLSEGQLQRLAIARAVLSNAPILLLDECTSALDTATEQTVLERLSQLPERMCIAVTHRPAAQEYSRCALEIHDGKIIVK